MAPVPNLGNIIPKLKEIILKLKDVKKYGVHEVTVSRYEQLLQHKIYFDPFSQEKTLIVKPILFVQLLLCVGISI